MVLECCQTCWNVSDTGLNFLIKWLFFSFFLDSTLFQVETLQMWTTHRSSLQSRSFSVPSTSFFQPVTLFTQPELNERPLNESHSAQIEFVLIKIIVTKSDVAPCSIYWSLGLSQWLEICHLLRKVCQWQSFNRFGCFNIETVRLTWLYPPQTLPFKSHMIVRPVSGISRFESYLLLS